MNKTLFVLVLKGLHMSFFSGVDGGGVCVHSDVCGSFHRDVSVYAWQLKITFSQGNVYRAQQNPLRLSCVCLERVSRRYAGLSRPPLSRSCESEGAEFEVWGEL